MRSSSKDSESSMNSAPSTKLQRFISSISNTLLNQMRNYLQKYQRFPQLRQPLKRKISLYQDIYTIVQLKENQQRILNYKTQLKSILQSIANKFDRKYITIYDRVSKKLNQLTPQQIAYLIENDQPLVFRNNTRKINDDNWPEYLKSSYSSSKSQFSVSDDDSQMSNSESQSSSQSNKSVQRNRRLIWRSPKNVGQFKQKLYERRKATQQNLIEGVQAIIRGSQEAEQSLSKNQIPIQNTHQQKSTDEILYDLSNPLEKEKFSSNVIKKWKQKSLPKVCTNQDRMLKDSKICYNFIKREYLFLNPNVMRSVWNNLKQQELRQIIKQKSATKKQKQSQMLQIEMYSPKEEKRRIQLERSNKIQAFQEDQIMRQSKKQSGKNERNSKLEFQKKVNDLPRHNQLFPRHYSPITQEWQLQDSKRKISKVRSQTCSSIVNSSQTNSKRQSGKDIWTKIKDPMQMLQEIVSKCDINSMKRQVKELLEKGLSIKQRLKDHIGKQDHKEGSNDIKEEEEKVSLEGIWSDQESSEEVESEQQPHNNNNSVQINHYQDESKPMIYWFNNDPATYETYQQHPYDLGHLMWTEEEDELMFKANRNLQQYIEDFKSLIEEKTPNYLLTRIKFLELVPSTQMLSLINNFLQYG